MPEINNALALGIKSEPVDMLGTFGKAQALKESQAKTNLLEQSYGHNEREYGENAGLTSGERSTMSKTQQEAMGPIGNILSNDQSPQARQQALSLAKRAGIPMDTLTEQHLLTAPAGQIKQYGVNAQRLGQSSSSNIEQSPNQIGNRAAATASGGAAGAVDAPYKPPGTPMTQPQVDSAISNRTNRDGSPRVLSMEGNVPVQPGAPEAQPGITSLEKKAIIDARTAERTGTAAKNVEEFAGYKQSAANSSTTKTVLRSLQDDAERVYTGKGATNKGDAQKWILAASNLPGVGPLVKHFAGDQSDPVAAIENIRKNIGIISRQAVGDIHETSAAALESVQNSLPTEEMSSKGLKLATSQMMAIEDFKQARLQSAQKWKDSHNGTLDGFAADWSKNMGPATFVMARLPKEEQVAVRARLNATPEGRRTLDGIDKQLQWGHKNGLDSVID